MPRKTKEINDEKTVKKQSQLDEKIDALIKNVLEPNTDVVEDKKPAKKAKAKSTSTTKSNAKTATQKTVRSKTAKASVKKETAKTETQEATPKKATKSIAKEKAKVTKKSTTKKATSEKTTKSEASKTTKAKSTVETTTKAKTKSKSKSSKIATPTIVEYYDLPYKYNQTVVKVLYQNPTTLFVYWEISDSDIENYKKTYGNNFFETTKPVLVVYNDTMNYSFEIDINDFANSWYLNINDSKCEYRVELIRRPVFYNEKIKTDYVHITSSNKMETPNDKILFSTDEPHTVYFRNTKNNSQKKVNLPKLLDELNLSNKTIGFPIVRNVYDLYKNIYNIEDVGEFSVSLTNPSSANPSSHSLSLKFN